MNAEEVQQVDQLSTVQWLIWTLLIVFIVGLVAASIYRRNRDADRLPVRQPLPEFSFTDQNGQTVSGSSLRGQIWVANFMFTRCSGTCPMTVNAMAQVDKAIGPRSDVKLISFSMDPETDTPEVLKKYAESRELTTQRWHFLTGKKEDIQKLTVQGFLLTVGENPDNKEEPIVHSTKLALVDADGRVRDYYGTTPDDLQKLARDIPRLAGEGKFNFALLPALNAILNSIVTVLLIAGYVTMKQRKLVTHKKCMLTAGVLSALFLTSYVIYHLQVGAVKFQHEGWPRTVYLTILFTHVVLAAVTAVLVPKTFYHALRGQWETHKRISRYSFPIWLYVAITGVLVYVMLYMLWPGTVS